MSQIIINPQEYSENNHPQYHIVKQHLSLFDFRGDETILDIGCGDGKVTGLLTAYTNNTICGIDRSAAMIAFANNYAQQNTMYNLKFLVANAENFTLGPFDLITSFFCVHLIGNVFKMLQCIQYSMLANGCALLLFPAENNYFSDIINELSQVQPWSQYFAANNQTKQIACKTHYEQAIAANNLCIKAFNEQQFQYCFANQESFKNWLKTTLHSLKLIPNNLRNMYLTQAITLYNQYINTNFGITTANTFIFNLYNIILSQKNT